MGIAIVCGVCALVGLALGALAGSEVKNNKGNQS
jgi:hypothetical protein